MFAGPTLSKVQYFSMMNHTAFFPVFPLQTKPTNSNMSTPKWVTSTISRRSHTFPSLSIIPNNCTIRGVNGRPIQSFETCGISRNNLETVIRTFEQSSSPISPYRPSPPQPPQRKREPDFHANVGTVIDTLRVDYPNMFSRPPELNIFRDDLVISDTNGNHLMGKDTYRAVLFFLRAHAKLFLASPSLHIVTILYDDHLYRPAVRIRWRMRTALRVWTSPKTHSPIIVDGISVYYLDCSGWVYHHSFESRIRNSQKPLRLAFDYLPVIGQVAVDTACTPFSSHKCYQPHQPRSADLS